MTDHFLQSLLWYMILVGGHCRTADSTTGWPCYMESLMDSLSYHQSIIPYHAIIQHVGTLSSLALPTRSWLIDICIVPKNNIRLECPPVWSLWSRCFEPIQMTSSLISYDCILCSLSICTMHRQLPLLITMTMPVALYHPEDIVTYIARCRPRPRSCDISVSISLFFLQPYSTYKLLNSQ